MFELDPLLATDTVPVCDLGLSRVLLMDDSRYPWVILVPMRDGLREIHDLDAAARSLLMEEVAAAAQALEEIYLPDKINIGALGNVVAQLHVHVVARRVDDPAWPGPVWGHSPALRYEPAVRARTADRIAAALSNRISG